MKINVDFEACEGHGECVVAAPELFDLDDSGEKAVLLQEYPEDEQTRSNAIRAAKLCPVAAIQIED